jgi:hypothetical protein
VQPDLEIMGDILHRCRTLAGERDRKAWAWYAVFVTAWHRLDRQEFEGVAGYEALKYSLAATQKLLQEMKETKEEAGHSQQEGVGV